MRLWSFHPQYLDTKGLLAAWREGLLALKVLKGQTRGYSHHPQLTRFRQHANPLDAMQYYLAAICTEAERRQYHFDRCKIQPVGHVARIPVSTDQLTYEWQHFLNKIAVRDPIRRDQLNSIQQPLLHPLFFPVDGPIEPWEKISRPDPTV